MFVLIRRSRSLVCAVLMVVASLPVLAYAADPPAADAKGAAPTDAKASPAASGTPPSAAAAAPTAEAAAAPAAATDKAMPGAPEPLLLARLAAKTLPTDFIKLGDDAQPILARYRAATKPPAKGAVLFIPAPGRFIGDDAVIAAALAELPEGGWSVLAVQTPLLPAVATTKQYDETHDQALARAKKGLEYLAQQQSPATVVVGRAGSVELAREVAGAAGEVAAVAALGPWSGEIGKSKMPLLDLSPERERIALARAGERKQEASRAKLEIYKQVVLTGADQRYIGFETEIARRIRGFAEHLPPPGKGAAAPGS
jgi:hypothetical protein